MKEFFTAAWCLTDEASFKRAIPFDLLGESIRKHGSTAKFNVVLLEGIERLSSNYLDSLRDQGFVIIDYCREFDQIVNRFGAIDRFYVRYERNCFLRWIAFGEIFLQRKLSQFWHLDGDVVMHTSLNALMEDTIGKTFMLQGCPVFVSIADFTWFESYERELGALNNDIHGYSQIASREKEECLKNDFALMNQCLYRNPIGSDQDLLEYLISSGRILQDKLQTISGSKYYFMQNPLSVERWHETQASGEHFRTANDSDKILIANREIPFIHYQGTFSNFAEIYLLLESLRLPKSLLRSLLQYKIREDKIETSHIFRILYKLKNKLKADSSRTNLIVRMNRLRSGELEITRLLNFLLDLNK